MAPVHAGDALVSELRRVKRFLRRQILLARLVRDRLAVEGHRTQLQRVKAVEQLARKTQHA